MNEFNSLNRDNIYFFQPNQHDLGIRIDKYLSFNLKDITRSRIKSLIESNNLLNNGKVINSCSYIVKQFDNYQFTIPIVKQGEMLPNNIDLNIIYEDTELLVINKPVGMTVHPGAGNYNDTLANALLAYCGDSLSGIGGVQRPGIVHRLDKDTSGLIVVAKNDYAHNYLSKQLATRSLTRVYSALVWGNLIPPSGTITTNIARSNRDRTKMMVVKTGGKEAITHYKTIQTYGNIISQIECKLSTGRTHQIRLHFSHLGHSLLGDQTYGNSKRKITHKLAPELSQEITKFKRQALHAKIIGFIHPKTEKYMEFEVELAEDIKNLIEQIEKYFNK
ncbi:MAG: RluA family pseudouridine synthase [Alphaproteobacteria bacterium]